MPSPIHSCHLFLWMWQKIPIPDAPNWLLLKLKFHSPPPSFFCPNTLDYGRTSPGRILISFNSYKTNTQTSFGKCDSFPGIRTVGCLKSLATSLVSSATGLNVMFQDISLFTNSLSFLIKHSRINSPSVWGLHLVAIRLANAKLASTAESFGLLILCNTSCCFLTDNFNSRNSSVVNISLFVVCFTMTYNVIPFANADGLSTD